MSHQNSPILGKGLQALQNVFHHDIDVVILFIELELLRLDPLEIEDAEDVLAELIVRALDRGQDFPLLGRERGERNVGRDFFLLREDAQVGLDAALGIGGLLQANRQKVFAVLGTLFSFLIAAGTGSLVAIGLAMG